MARKTVKVYDKNSKKWVTKKVDNTPKGKGGSSGKKQTTSKRKGKGGGSTSGGKATNPKSAKGKAKNSKKKKEYYALSGTVSVLPTAQNIKISTAQTVSLQGFGKWLTGKYYVATITRKIDGSNGYSETLEVYKPNFRSQIKKKTKAKTKPKSKKKKKTKKKKKSAKKLMLRGRSVVNTVKLTSSTSETSRKGNLHTYTIHSTGDSLWNIAKRFYGDSSKWDRLYEYNTGEKPDPLNLAIGMKIVIP